MKKIVLIISGVFIFNLVNAQTLESEFGINKEETLKRFSLYTEDYKNKDYKAAYENWRYLFDNAPRFRMSTYTRGAVIVKNLYKKEKDPKYWDELMEIYEKRIKYYGNSKKYPKGYVLGKKSLDIYRYKKNDPKALKKAYDTFLESINLQDVKSEPKVIDKAMAASVDLYKGGQLTKNDVINNFIRFDKLSDRALPTLTDKEHLKTMRNVKNNVQSYFIISECASCDDLTNIFSSKFEEAKDNVKELESISRILDRFDCADSELFSRIAQRQYELEPSAHAAYSLGAFFLKKRDLGQATRYLNEASQQQTDPYKKADIHMKLAKLNIAQDKYLACKQEAIKALGIRSDWGEPHLLIAQAYAAGANAFSSDAYDRGTVFWVAVDRLYKAKKDPEFTSKAGQLIGKYSGYFPNCEEMFFRGVKKGTSYRVGGWIGESTTARCRK